jgi:hypothetical protein
MVHVVRVGSNVRVKENGYSDQEKIYFLPHQEGEGKTLFFGESARCLSAIPTLIPLLHVVGTGFKFLQQLLNCQ